MALPRWRKLKIIVVLVSFTVGLLSVTVLGEITLRWSERNRTSVPETMPYLYYQHSRLRYALVRNSDYYGWAHVNRQGFRGTRDVSLAKPEGRLRIMAVGGSTTFDTTVSGDDRTWAACMERRLRELIPNREVEVINAGVPGYRNLDNLIRLETELYRYKPDVIVLYEVHNDLYEALKTISDPPDMNSQTPDALPTSTPWGRWLERNSLLYMKLNNATKLFKFMRSKRQSAGQEDMNARVAEALERGAADFERNVTVFVAVANSFGIHVVMPEVMNVSGSRTLIETDLAIRQIWQINFPYTTPETILHGYERYNEATRKVAGCAGSATHIPTGDFNVRGAEWFAPFDPIHANDRGAERIGRNMAEVLLESGALEFRQANAAGCGKEEKSALEVGAR